jgi:hypothetical protein
MSTVKFDQWYTSTGHKRQMIVQAVQAVKTNIWSGTGTGQTWLTTDFFARIVPKSASNKILLMATLQLSSGYWELQGRYNRNGTVFGVGRRQSAVSPCGFHCSHYMGNYQDFWYPTTYSYLDTPNTTSPLIYTLELNGYGGNSVYINKIEADWDNSDYAGNPISTITLLEIQG